MPIIPDLPAVTGSYQPSTPSLTAAMAPGLALSNLGEGITKAAATAGKYLVRREKQQPQDPASAGDNASAGDPPSPTRQLSPDDLRTLRNDQAATNRIIASFQQSDADHLAYRTENPNPSTWATDREQRTAAVRDQAAGETASPAGKQRIQQLVDSATAHYATATARDVENQTTANARTANTRLVQQFASNGKFDDARALLLSGHTSGLFTPIEYQADLKDLNEREIIHKADVEEDARKKAIAEDPFSAQAAIDAMPAGPQRERYAAVAREARLKQAAEVKQLVDKGLSLAGNIRTIGDVQSLVSHLGKPVQKQILKLYQAATAPGETARRATREYQDTTVGEISAMFARYKPDADDIHHQFVALHDKINSLAEGPAKTDFTEKLNDHLEGRVRQVRSIRDVYLRTLDQDDAITESHITDPATTTMPVARLLDDGFLKDGNKLQQLGFSADQASRIMDPQQSPAYRLRLFRTTWNARANAAGATASSFDRRAAEAILNYKEHVSTIPKDELDSALSAHYHAAGQRKIALLEFFETAKDPSDAEIRAKVRSLSTAPVVTSVRTGKVEPRPVRK